MDLQTRRWGKVGTNMPGSHQKKNPEAGRGIGAALFLCLLAALVALALFLRWQQGWFPSVSPVTPTPDPTVEATPTPSPTLSPDTEPPVIEGPHDLTVAVGMTLSYRSGVSAVDKVDGPVPFQIDATAVNLSQAGEYPVIYRAEDQSGNRAETTVTVTVVEVHGVNDDDPTADVSGETPAPELSFPPLPEVTEQMVDELSDQILSRIVTPTMSQWEKARAIFNYVNTHVKYVGSSDKSNWLIGAYVGFTRNRGDCYNYFACSKALLTRAGIPNVDLYRVGGHTDHYWQLVNVGSGWYHFDACPHPNSYPLTCFLLDEAAVRAYTEKCAPVRNNYYVYDYENCPVIPVGTPVEELPAESEPVETGTGETPEVIETPEVGDPDETEALLPPGVLEGSTPSPEPVPSEEPPAELTTPPVDLPFEEPPPDPVEAPESQVPSEEPTAEIPPPAESNISGKDDPT